MTHHRSAQYRPLAPYRKVEQRDVTRLASEAHRRVGPRPWVVGARSGVVVTGNTVGSVQVARAQPPHPLVLLASGVPLTLVLDLFRCPDSRELYRTESGG